MQADFWQTRWANNQIGFHQAEVNGYLQRHWPSLGVKPGERVLVPLCGKSRDMAWLAGQGLQVVGVELAEKAAEEFFREQGVEPEVTEQGAFTRYAHDAVEILCGDFFALSAGDVAGCTAVYDRAAVIALPPGMRRRYAQHLQALLPAVKGLLITLDYDQSVIDGPPFSVGDAEVRELFAAWQPKEVEVQEVLQESPKFLQAGAQYLLERAYFL